MTIRPGERLSAGVKPCERNRRGREGTGNRNTGNRPQINQIERHPHYQRKEDLEVMKELGVQPQAWAPFAEGLKGMFEEPVLKEIA